MRPLSTRGFRRDFDYQVSEPKVVRTSDRADGLGYPLW